MKNINIIGGGISGLITALTLEKNNQNYNLYEKHNRISYDNVGLGISANIFPILKELNLFEETKKLGTEIKEFHFIDRKRRYLKSFKLKHAPLSINRKLFHEYLSSNLNTKNIHLKSFKTAHDFNKNSIVISADGIMSKTRQSIYPKLELRNSKQILWRGISEIKLDNNFQNCYHDYIGLNKRFAIIHTGKNFYSWYLILNNKNLDETQNTKEYILNFVKEYSGEVIDVIKNTTDIYTTSLLDINPNNRRKLNWFYENVLMIGDAIHPTTPNMANGACLAIEDAFCIANMLLENESTQNIFEKFQKIRQKKIDPIVLQSWLFGKLMHQNSEIMDYFVELGIKLTPQILFDKIYSKILVETKNNYR